MSPRPAFVLLTAMLLVAGCVGSPVENTGTSSPATGTTEFGTPLTETTTQQESTLPSGISDDGQINSSNLLFAHEPALSKTGYEFEYRSVSETDGEKATVVSQWGTVAEGRTSFERYAEYASDSSQKRYQAHLWANDTVLLTKQDTDEQVRYTERMQTEPLRHELASVGTLTRILEAILGSGEFEVVNTDRSDGQSLVTLSATEPTDETQFENVTNFDATLVVDSSGRVREFHRTVETDRMRLEQDFELTLTAVTSVERPEWAEKARAATAANIEVETTKHAIELEHAGGETLSAGSTVRIEHDGKTHVREFDRPFKPGERLYIYYPADGSAPVLAAEPAAVAVERIDGSYSMAVLDSNGNTVTAMGLGVGHSDGTDSSSESS
ncbi:hypothetical protein [Haladaptatus caseinilyticus]|uniref:hypothetical protein n=1 Tax=Haladaptatus caseinilyticus TaxID=2993314 RepID=UPI00224AF7EB|nr:hypothetical protein [Haladaptatus caseinilyticus]